MGLAGEDELDRALAAKEGDCPLRQQCEEVQALVGGEAAGETDGETPGIESGARGLGIVHRVATTQAMGRASLRDHVDQLPACRAARCPQFARGDVAHGLPGRSLVGTAQPSCAQVAIEQCAHRAAQPGGHVHTVRDMRDRNRVGRTPRKQRLPHGTGHLGVTPADRVDPTARAQGERRHARRLIGVCRVDAASGEELLAVAGQVGDAPERRQHLVALVGLVAGRHRGVGREHHLLAHPLPRGVETGHFLQPAPWASSSNTPSAACPSLT